MTLRIDPSLPLLWRTPHEVQLGLERPAVRLRDLSRAQEHMLAALTEGTSPTGLTLLARAHGSPETQVAELLELVAPALERPTTAPTVLVADGADDRDGAAAAIAAALTGCGVRVIVGDEEADSVDLVVAITDFVFAPDWYGRWLRHDLPHLPVVFGGQTVRIGPLVEPGRGPCLYCAERAHRDIDPTWPALAAQLWGRVSPARTPLVVAEVTALAVRTVLARLRPPATTGEDGVRIGADHDHAEVAVAVDLETVTGAVSRLSIPRHPQCECATLGGTGSATVTPIGAAPRRPRRAAASSAPA